ncbi:MAG TPA: diguanylate cyclase [Chloroflexota bacterium]|nr:diguanylate cyclase [Chloroflexota bacterium]
MARRVLVVDDEPEIAELVALRLQQEGHAVDTAPNGNVALEVLAGSPFDLVFLDVSMPGLSGLEVLDRLRARDTDVAVVLMTGHGSEDIVVDALRRGADDYLRKPFSVGEFSAVLQRTLARLDMRRQNEDLRRQLAERAAEMEQQALTDELTGLPNRRAFDHHLDRLVRAVERGSQFSMLMLDIDHFKKVNDTHGHAAGDRVLQELADTLQSRIRVSDVAARVGGEEFAVLLPRASASEAARVAEALRVAVQERDIRWNGRRIPITISIGVADSAVEGSIAEAADAALYRAKANGRNVVVVDV